MSASSRDTAKLGRRKLIIVFEFEPVHQAILIAMTMHGFQQIGAIQRLQPLWPKTGTESTEVVRQLFPGEEFPFLLHRLICCLEFINYARVYLDCHILFSNVLYCNWLSYSLFIRLGERFQEFTTYFSSSVPFFNRCDSCFNMSQSVGCSTLEYAAPEL